MLYIFDVDGTLVRSFLREHNGKTVPNLDRPGPLASPTPDEAQMVERAYDDLLATGALERRPDLYDRVEVLPGRLQVLERLAAEGHTFAIATNQAGAVLGYQTIPQVHAKMGRVAAELHHFFRRPYSVHIAFEHRASQDPAYRSDPDRRRKPGPGLLLEAIAAHGAETAVFVGDMETDRLAAEAAILPYHDAAEFFS